MERTAPAPPPPPIYLLSKKLPRSWKNLKQVWVGGVTVIIYKQELQKKSLKIYYGILLAARQIKPQR